MLAENKLLIVAKNLLFKGGVARVCLDADKQESTNGERISRIGY